MSDIPILNVTLIEPRLKHPTIFSHFDALGEGEAFLLHNDHDPKPLYYQLLGERGDIFTWNYEQAGPEVWQIRIAKKVLSGPKSSVGEISAGDLRKAEVFKKFGIDFCCGGNKSLEEACGDAGASAREVEAELARIPSKPVSVDKDFNHWNLDFLIDYIVNVHHKYVVDSTPMIFDLSQKVTQRHARTHPELDGIHQHTTALLTEMKAHQTMEERVLFPFIKRMVESEKDGKPVGNPPFGTVESPVQMMEDDHQSAGRHIHEIERLSHKYQVPEDGCESYKLYFHKLYEFNDDLWQHLHLENNILFPKSVRLEKELIQK